jgi:hypothetical protein
MRTEDDDYQDDDICDDSENQLEQYIADKLNNCICGAYTLDSKGRLTLVADCCCGA